MIAIYNPDKNVFLSPIAEDSPAAFIERPFDTDVASSLHIETVSRFGRDFSIVCIPYCLKLLIQELQAMNVVLRLITEDNIQQLSNLAYRTVIPSSSDKVVSDPTFVKRHIQATQAALRGEETAIEHIRISSEDEDEDEDEVEEPLKKIVFSPSRSSPMEEEEYAVEAPSDYYPPSPTSPPPPSPQPTIPFSGETIPVMASTFVKGEHVQCIGDNKPSRIWTVTDIAPETNMVTIETEDPEGLSDTIRVILDPANHLRRIPPASSMSGGEQSIYGGGGMAPPLPPPQGIVFAPTIHVGNTFGPTVSPVTDDMFGGAVSAPAPAFAHPLPHPPSMITSSQKPETKSDGGGGILQSIVNLGKSFVVRKAES
jgi:hypothetical protein